MSRKASIGSSLPSNNPSDDICPVCKSNRYLNPNLEFLINPECYHRMCSSCVDRLFTSGPAPCPVAGCHRTLRKRGFRKAFFGDLGIEREVDIRRRVSAVFNRREDDFETLLDYNNYLENVERLVFDLVNGSKEEKKKAEEELERWRTAFTGEIEENKRREKEEGDMRRRTQAMEREAARQRRQALAQQDEQERAEMARGRQAALERLATGQGDADALSQIPDRQRPALDVGVDGGLTIRGLKKKEVVAPEKAYDPFGELHLETTRYVLQNEYASEWLDAAKREPKHIVGGYSMQEYYARAMFEAFSGLGVFVAEEAGQKTRPSTFDAPMPGGTHNPGQKVLVGKSSDDVF